MKGTGIIIKKELRRVFSDKKLVFSLFILPGMIVIAIYGIMGFMIESMSKDITEHISNVYVVNATEDFRTAADSSGYSEGADIKYLSANEFAADEAQLRDGVLNGDIDLLVVFDSEFEKKIAAYSKAGDAIPQIKVSYNSTENYSSQAFSVLSGLMSDYQTQLLAQRIGNLEMLDVFSIEKDLIVREEKANTEFISMILPYMITIMLFAGAMSVGVDAIAGEKERGTLASMLITPIRRSDIVVGKLISMSILSSLSAIVYAISMIVAMPVMRLSMGANTAASGFGTVSFGPVQIIELLLIMLVMVYFDVSVIGLLAVIAKDTKTASSYISPIYIVATISGMLTMFMSGKDIPTYRYMIPVYGNALAIKDLCGNELAVTNFLASFLGTLAVGVIFTALMTRAFNDEKYMFNA